MFSFFLALCLSLANFVSRLFYAKGDNVQFKHIAQSRALLAQCVITLVWPHTALPVIQGRWSCMLITRLPTPTDFWPYWLTLSWTYGMPEQCNSTSISNSAYSLHCCWLSWFPAVIISQIWYYQCCTTPQIVCISYKCSQRMLQNAVSNSSRWKQTGFFSRGDWGWL